MNRHTKVKVSDQPTVREYVEDKLAAKEPLARAIVSAYETPIGKTALSDLAALLHCLADEVRELADIYEEAP